MQESWIRLLGNENEFVTFRLNDVITFSENDIGLLVVTDTHEFRFTNPVAISDFKHTWNWYMELIGSLYFLYFVSNESEPQVVSQDIATDEEFSPVADGPFNLPETFTPPSTENQGAPGEPTKWEAAQLGITQPDYTENDLPAAIESPHDIIDFADSDA